MTVLGTDFLSVLPVVFAVLLVVVICRWVFGNRGVRHVIDRPDYGLLTPVTRLDSEAEAERVSRRLAAEGIRGTVAPAGRGFDVRGIPWPPDANVVLVFPDDAERASAVLAGRHERPADPSW